MSPRLLIALCIAPALSLGALGCSPHPPPCPSTRDLLADARPLNAEPELHRLASSLCTTLTLADSAGRPVSLGIRGPTLAAITAVRESLTAWGYAFPPPSHVPDTMPSPDTATMNRLHRMVREMDSALGTVTPDADIRVLDVGPGWYLYGDVPAPRLRDRDAWITRFLNMLKATSCEIVTLAS